MISALMAKQPTSKRISARGQSRRKPPGLPATYASGRRIARLTATLLNSAQGETEQRLSEMLGVSSKGIERYLNALKLEFPGQIERVGSGSQRRVRFRRGDGSISQLGVFPYAAAFFAGQFLNWVNGTRLHDEHASALRKLELRLADQADQPLPTLANKFRFFPRAPKDLRLHRAKLDTIVEALLGQWEIDVTYTDAKGARKRYPQFQPLTLSAYQEALYLIGQKRDGKHRFFLAIERIEAVERLATRFDYPHHYDPDDLRKDAFGVFQGESMHVELRFAPHLVPAIESRRWHGTQKFKREADGSLRMSLRTSGDADLVSWILGYGAGVEVLAPETLRRRVADDLKKAAQLYQG